MNSPAIPEPENMRASDADRERVAEILRQAAGEGRLTLDELDQRLDTVYAAKTYADLEPVTHDLPVFPVLPKGAVFPKGAAPLFESPHGGLTQPPMPPGGGPAAPQLGSGLAHRFGGPPGSSVAVAIMGGFTRKGDWVVPREFNAFTLMGCGEIDMRDARFEEQSVTLHVVAIMGGFEITVPVDATVHVNGIGIMGGFDHGASGGGTPGGPVITVSGLALMGGVEIKRKRSKSARLSKPEREARELE